MQGSGAQAALRGYRLQTEYALYRILIDRDDAVFQLEGAEDIDILDRNGRGLERVQVKAHGSPLKLSDLHPDRPHSFLRRVLRRLQLDSSARERLVSFSGFSPDLERAWNTDGAERARVLDWFAKHGFGADEAHALIRGLVLEAVDHGALSKRISEVITDSVAGCDPIAATQLLSSWLHEGAERQIRVTRQDVLRKLLDVGRFISDWSAHQHEWFSTIVPLEPSQDTCDGANLAREFYQGVAARLEHILAGVDVPRQRWLETIDSAFRAGKRLVIVHAASGQGKSSLAYRYMYERADPGLRFEVRPVEGERGARRVAQALASHLSALDLAGWVYVDAQPGSAAWASVARDLLRHPTVRVLVTVREEDWHWTALPEELIGRAEPVALQLDEPEARAMYEQITAIQRPPHVLSFEEAWSLFGQRGPLLEFVHLVTQSESLEERLRRQVNRLQDRIRRHQLNPEELELLRRVAVVSAYGARLDLHSVVTDLRLRAPSRTVELFEEEYLLRTSDDGRLLDGLHPIRSAVLARLLVDEAVQPWSTVVSAMLTEVVEQDIEGFLLHAFSRRPSDRGALVDALRSLQPRTWTGVGGVLRALLWLAVRRYMDRNVGILREAYQLHGRAWWVVTTPDIANTTKFMPDFRPPLESLGLGRSPFADKLEPGASALRTTAEWLRGRCTPSEPPSSTSDWAALAEVTFWLYHLEVSNDDLRASVAGLLSRMQDVNLDVAADLLYSCSLSDVPEIRRAAENAGRDLLPRYQQELDVLGIEDDGEQVTAHFIVGFGEVRRDSEAHGSAAREGSSADDDVNVANEQAVHRVEVLRGLVPGRRRYGARGYGHRLDMLEGAPDDSVKNIPVENLPPRWPPDINGRFIQLVQREFRTPDWPSYGRTVMIARTRSVHAAEILGDALSSLARRPGLTMLRSLAKTLEQVDLAANQKLWDQASVLPVPAVDEWGFVGEGHRGSPVVPHGFQMIKRNALVLHQYRRYLKVLRDYELSQSVLLQSLAGYGQTLLGTVGRVAQRKPRAGDGGKLRHDANSRKTGKAAWNALLRSLRDLGPLQATFRDRFASVVGADDLPALEERECRVLRTLAVRLREAFNAFETGVLPSRLGGSTQALDTAGKALRSRLEAALRPLQHSVGQVRVHPSAPPWEEQPALWITMDSEHPGRWGDGILQLVARLYSVLSSGPDVHLSRAVVAERWTHVCVVPLVHARAVRPAAWCWSSEVLMVTGPANMGTWNLLLRPVPPSTWERLDIPSWGDEALLPALRLQEHRIELAWLLATQADIRRVPEHLAIEATVLARHQAQQEAEANRVWQAMRRQLGEMERLGRANDLGLDPMARRARELRLSMEPSGPYIDSAAWWDKLDRLGEDWIAAATARLARA